MVIRFALHIHLRSPSAYKALKESSFIKLPSERTLHDYSNVFHPSPGFKKETFEDLKHQASNSRESENMWFWHLMRKVDCCGTRRILYGNIVDIYKAYRISLVGKLPKLSNEHINLNSYSKMRVNLAAQVMSETVAKVMSNYGPDSASETVKFIFMIDRFFNCCNLSLYALGFQENKLGVQRSIDTSGSNPKYQRADLHLAARTVQPSQRMPSDSRQRKYDFKMAVKEGAANMNVNGITLTAYQQQQLHAHQMAILQKILVDQNVGLITNEEENEERDASRPPSPTSPAAAAASAPSFETNEDQLDELLINEVQLYRCLWDPRARAYKETPKKNEAWK
eukprot:gene9967-18583_t